MNRLNILIKAVLGLWLIIALTARNVNFLMNRLYTEFILGIWGEDGNLKKSVQNLKKGVQNLNFFVQKLKKGLQFFLFLKDG